MGNKEYRKDLIKRHDSYSCISNVRKNIGPFLAGEVIKEFGSIEGMEKYKLEERLKERIVKLSWLSNLTKVQAPRGKEIKDTPYKILRGKLSKLRSLGFNIKPYSNMGKNEIINYLGELRKNFSKKLDDAEYKYSLDRVSIENMVLKISS